MVVLTFENTSVGPMWIVAEYRLFYKSLLQKSPLIGSILLKEYGYIPYFW